MNVNVTEKNVNMCVVLFIAWCFDFIDTKISGLKSQNTYTLIVFIKLAIISGTGFFILNIEIFVILFRINLLIFEHSKIDSWHWISTLILEKLLF